MKFNVNILYIIAGMTAVTYLPRLLPFYIFSKINLSKRMMLFLKCIPYSALGALIFPDVLSSVPSVYIAVFGAAVAALLTYKFENMIITVAGAVFTVYASLMIFSNHL
ncbi:MAG: AzlD domain-containing protein [Fusobacterium sp.]